MAPLQGFPLFLWHPGRWAATRRYRMSTPSGLACPQSGSSWCGNILIATKAAGLSTVSANSEISGSPKLNKVRLWGELADQKLHHFITSPLKKAVRRPPLPKRSSAAHSTTSSLHHSKRRYGDRLYQSEAAQHTPPLHHFTTQKGGTATASTKAKQRSSVHCSLFTVLCRLRELRYRPPPGRIFQMS